MAGKEKVEEVDLSTYMRDQEKDIAVQETKLESSQADLSDFEAKIDEKFIPYLQEVITEEELEVIEISDDIAEIAGLILAKREQFVDEQIEPRKAQVAEFRAALDGQKADLQNNQIVSEFSTAHPEVDMQAFKTFVRGELTPNQMAQFEEESAGDPMKFYELVLGLFQGGKKKEEKEEDLPPDLDSLPSAAAGKLKKDNTTTEEYNQNALGIGRGY